MGQRKGRWGRRVERDRGSPQGRGWKEDGAEAGGLEKPQVKRDLIARRTV